MSARASGNQSRSRPRAQHSAAYRQLCSHLRQWRTDAGLTQRGLGDLLHKPHSFVHKVETGERRIDPVELILWCRATGLRGADAIAIVERALRA